MNPAVSFTLLLPLLPFFYLLIIEGRRRRSSNRLPPGSLGIPIIGQSLEFLRAMRSNTAEKWLEERVRKYGVISKLTLFGKPTVFIHGSAANKLVFNSESDTLTTAQPQSLRRILGDKNILEFRGEDHKRMRNALMSFLKPEELKQYVGKMDEEVRKHLDMHWKGKQEVSVLPLMKSLTFNIICSLLFGVEPGTRREEFLASFQRMIEGMWSVPVNLPFTRFNRSLKASLRVRKMVTDIVGEKRVALEQGQVPASHDLITKLLSIRDEDGAPVVSEKEIVENVMLVMVAGYDTSSVLITFLVRLLANDPDVYSAMIHEQEEIAKSKDIGELLTWEDVSKMKYTWRVALETLRIFPPVLGGFRKALKDIEFGGYLIPKGWQIFWAANMTQRDESIFPESMKFDPSRFDQNITSIPPYCFVAFGAGPRICPGYEFARLETLVVMHYLLTRFTWKLCCSNHSSNGNENNDFIRDPMPVFPHGLLIHIQPICDSSS